MKPEISNKAKNGLLVTLALVIAAGLFLSVRGQAPADYRYRIQSTTYVPVSAPWIAKHSADLSEVLTTATISPYTEWGSLRGFRLTKVDPGSPIETLKLKTEDILYQVDDLVLNYPEVWLDAFKAIKGKSDVRVVIQRDGKVMGMAYKVIEP